jgi:5-methylcytosine-specific restriction protein A
MPIIKHLVDAAKGKHPITAARSPHWSTVRKRHLEKFPTCAVCGGNVKLQVHHRHPFHLHPELELEESNLITLCEAPGRNCHLIFGHLSISAASTLTLALTLRRGATRFLTGHWPTRSKHDPRQPLARNTKAARRRRSVRAWSYLVYTGKGPATDYVENIKIGLGGLGLYHVVTNSTAKKADDSSAPPAA